MLKQIIIPVAAFVITATSAAAFTSVDWSELDVDLSVKQIEALNEAQEIRQNANEQARTVLEDAGIDVDKMAEIRQAERKQRQVEHEAVRTAIEDEDYDEFMAAVADTPLADAITTQADFERFLEAHQLMEDGDYEAAEEIMSDLGLEGPGGRLGGPGDGRGMEDGFGGPGHGGNRPSTGSKHN